LDEGGTEVLGTMMNATMARNEREEMGDDGVCCVVTNFWALLEETIF
jgi:hypothetical protein